MFQHCLVLVCWIFLLAATSTRAADDYRPGPDAERKPGVPVGAVTKHKWTSEIFKGTVREYSVYMPKQCDGKTPACIIVFQDGSNYVNEKGPVRVPIVFDNLIHDKVMPVTVGIFIQPGEFPPTKAGEQPKKNRSFEYDTLSDQYAQFLLDEILPEVAKLHPLSDKPEDRAICGMSSGGICAFTVAWERPQSFGKVVSHIGSFTNIRGGHVYPSLIRKTEKKPIRVFLQDGSGDLDNAHGNWPLANQQMAKALAYAKYDYKFEYGDGAHNPKHGGAIFPDTMRWLWRDHPQVVSTSGR